MVLPRQTLIRTGELARELGVTGTTIGRWSHEHLKPAIFRRGYFKVQVLREMGVLPTPGAAEMAQVPK